jgi:hypothetical protein
VKPTNYYLPSIVTLHRLSASLVPADMSGLISPVVHEILAKHSDAGDVQTCATLALLMEGRVQPPIEQRSRLRWIDAYVSLLHRLRLFSVAAAVMSSCSKEDSLLLKSRSRVSFLVVVVVVVRVRVLVLFILKFES